MCPRFPIASVHTTTPRISPFLAGLTLVVLLQPSRSPGQAPRQHASSNFRSPNPRHQRWQDPSGPCRHWPVPPLEPGLRRLPHASRGRAQRAPSASFVTAFCCRNPRGPRPRLQTKRVDALHFIAIHPKFAQNQLVYLSYPKMDGKRSTLAVARGRLSGAKLTEFKKFSSPTHGRPAVIRRAECSSLPMVCST